MTRKLFKRKGICGYNSIEIGPFVCEDQRSRANERMAFQIDRLKETDHVI